MREMTTVAASEKPRIPSMLLFWPKRQNQSRDCGRKTTKLTSVVASIIQFQRRNEGFDFLFYSLAVW